MTLVVITLIVLAIAVWDTHRRVRNVSTTTNRRVSDMRNDVKTLLQDIADKIDAEQAASEDADKRILESLSTLDTKIHALASASGYELVNGLWQKQKPVRKPTTKATVLKGAAPTAAKKATKGGK